MSASLSSGLGARSLRGKPCNVSFIVISIGSNVEPEQNLRSAVRFLRREFDDLVLSPVYRSAAVGFDGADFLNLVASARTDAAPDWVAARLRHIETDHRRDRSAPRLGPRTLDLDLLLYDEQVLKKGILRLPRAEITEHAFVLRPLADLLPNARHPLMGMTYSELWARFPQKNAQPLWPIALTWDEHTSNDPV